MALRHCEMRAAVVTPTAGDYSQLIEACGAARRDLSKAFECFFAPWTSGVPLFDSSALNSKEFPAAINGNKRR